MIYQKTALIIRIFTLFILLLTTQLAQVVEAQAQEQRTHVVRAGDTLFGIARTYDVSVEDLRAWNRLRGNQINVGQRLIVSGTESRPTPSTPPPPTPVSRDAERSSEVLMHRVASGETLFSISRRYGVTVAEIREWNRLSGNIIEVGQVLQIRGSTQNIVEPNPADIAVAPQGPPVTGGTTPPVGRPVVPGDGRPDSVGVAIPPGQAITTSPVSSAYYTVRRGDSISGIAAAHSISVADLMELNRLRNDRLAVGQVLLVRRPQGLPSVADRGTVSTPQGQFAGHEVRRGERLVDILRQFQMTESELAALNQDIDIADLRQGQTITVLLPPTRVYTNPYRQQTVTTADETTETINVTRYSDTDRGRATTSGDLFNPDALTAAHSRLPIGSVVYIENPDTGKGIFILINDRIIESGLKLSHASFTALGFRTGAQNQAVIRVNER